MSKITAVIVMLALGTSASVASAASSRSVDRRADVSHTRVDRDRNSDPGRFGRPAPIDHGWSRAAADDFGARRYRPTWVALSASLQLGRSGQDSIDVNDRNTFTQLRLQTTGGIARIDRVIIRFADGSDQVADLDRLLDRRGELLEIPLDGNNRRIDCITVIGDGDRGTLQLYGI
jgi:hypothetical protein